MSSHDLFNDIYRLTRPAGSSLTGVRNTSQMIHNILPDSECKSFQLLSKNSVRLLASFNFYHTLYYGARLFDDGFGSGHRHLQQSTVMKIRLDKDTILLLSFLRSTASTKNQVMYPI